MYTVRSIARLLSRHYDLMNTSYKFLKIGINIDSLSYVEKSQIQTVAVSQNVEEPLRTANIYNRIFTRCFETNTKTIL